MIIITKDINIMKKLSFNQLVSLIQYHRFERVTARNSKNGVPYYVFFCDKLDGKVKEQLQNYGNVQLGRAVSQYAPEQRKTVVFVYDKNIKLV